MIDLPGTWEETTLGDAVDVLIDHRGKTPKKLGGDFVDSGVPAISAMNIKDGRVDLSRRGRFVTHEMFERWMPERLRLGDVLMTSEAPVGSLALVPSDAPLVLSQRLFALRGRDGYLDNRYLRWYLESPLARRQLDERSSGSTVTGIRKAELRQLRLPIPPFVQQRRIVDFLEDNLSRLDASIPSLDAAARRVSSLTASIVTPLIEGPSVRLGELARGARYGTSTKCAVDGQGIPVARIPNLVNGDVDLTDEKRAVDVSVDLSPLLLKRDDLLVVRTNGSRDLIGRSAVVGSDLPAAFASYLIRYRLDLERVRPRWVSMVLGSPQMRRVLEQMAASSAGQYNLSLPKLDSLQIPCPSLAVQDAALCRLKEADWSCSRIRIAIGDGRVRAATLRRSVLSSAFSGGLSSSTSTYDVRDIA